MLFIWFVFISQPEQRLHASEKQRSGSVVLLSGRALLFSPTLLPRKHARGPTASPGDERTNVVLADRGA